MKMMKKALVAASVLSLVLGFAACKNGDDDEQGMIQGSNKNYSINYENTGTDAVNRGYNATTFKHRGELVRFTFNNSGTDGGVLGFIWDLEKTDVKLEDGAKGRNFLVFGITLNKDKDHKFKYYASKYYNIANINESNFGATTLSGDALTSAINAGTACENDITGGFKTIPNVTGTNEKQLAFWADIYPTVKSGTTHKIGETDDTKNFTGAYTIDLYTGTAGEEDLTKVTKIDTITIDTSVTGYVAGDATSGTKVPQNYLAVYANVYSNSSLNGAWYLKQDYYEAEVVED